MCWIDWLSKHSMDWAKAGQIPARTSVRTDPKMAEVAAPIAAVIANADHAIMLPQVAALEGALWDQFGPVVDGYLTGEVTDLKTALEEANARSQQAMDENAAQYK
jgi:multiple sugar transport system substrate-binding protein